MTDESIERLADEALRRFPQWSNAQRERWVLAKLRAARLTPHYAKMLPLTVDAIPKSDAVFCPRVLVR